MAQVTLSDLAGLNLYLDANIFIYAIERHPAHAALLDALFSQIDSRISVATTSELTLAEFLAKPFADNDLPRQQLYQAAIAPRPHFAVVPVSREILIRAAQLRASHKARLPDAIHLATALGAACDRVITNDQLIRAVPGIEVVQLADVAP